MSDTLRGIVAMCLAMLFFCIGDTLVKLMGRALPPGEIVVIRGTFASLMMITACWWLGAFKELPRLRAPIVVWRIAMENLCTILFFIALIRMPYADSSAIAQFTPLAVMAGAAIFLAEPVGWRRWMATAVGLIGVLLIVKPGTSAFDPTAIVMLASVAAVAARDLITQRISKELPTVLLAATSAVSSIALGFGMSLFESHWRMPTGIEVATIALCAVTVMLAYMFVIVAMRHGPASATSPFRYTYMLFATVSSLLVFHEAPDLASSAGIALIIGSGLYMLHRERVVQRSRLATTVAKTA